MSKPIPARYWRDENVSFPRYRAELPIMIDRIELDDNQKMMYLGYLDGLHGRNNDQFIPISYLEQYCRGYEVGKEMFDKENGQLIEKYGPGLH